MKLGYAKLGSFYLSMKKKQSLEKHFNNNHTYTKRKKTKQSSSLWMKKWCNLPFFCFFHSHPYSWGFSISGNDKYRNPCKKVIFFVLCVVDNLINTCTFWRVGNKKCLFVFFLPFLKTFVEEQCLKKTFFEPNNGVFQKSRKSDFDLLLKKHEKNVSLVGTLKSICSICVTVHGVFSQNLDIYFFCWKSQRPNEKKTKTPAILLYAFSG